MTQISFEDVNGNKTGTEENKAMFCLHVAQTRRQIQNEEKPR